MLDASLACVRGFARVNRVGHMPGEWNVLTFSFVGYSKVSRAWKQAIHLQEICAVLFERVYSFPTFIFICDSNGEFREHRLRPIKNRPGGDNAWAKESSLRCLLFPLSYTVKLSLRASHIAHAEHSIRYEYGEE